MDVYCTRVFEFAYFEIVSCPNFLSASCLHFTGKKALLFDTVHPQVQQGNNSQNLNRYSYVINNPLRYTDPSGYNFLDLAAKWMPTIMATVIAGIPGANVIAMGALAGWVASGFELKGAVIGAISAAIFTGIGDAFQANSGFLTKDGIGHIFSHAMAGGLLSAAEGGKFGHGFVSAGLTKAASPYIDDIPSDNG